MSTSDRMGIADNKKILDLYQQMAKGTLKLQPSFQRKLVWNDKHKENFLDTILKRYPFPEVYFADGEIDVENLTSTTLVVDGQQRLSTIYDYISGSDRLVLKKIPKYADLSDEQKKKFLDYPVVVRNLGTLSSDELKEIFRRINSVGYALNAIEIDNALYEGEYISTAKEIVDTGLLKDLDFINDTDISRMKDVEFVLLIMTTIEVGGFFTSGKEVENYIKEYENNYPNKDNMIGWFVSCLKYINKLSWPADSFWNNKSCTFTLLVELISQVAKGKKLPNAQLLAAELVTLENKIKESKDAGKDNPYGKFYYYVYQNTSSKKARKTRGDLLHQSIDSMFA